MVAQVSDGSLTASTTVAITVSPGQSTFVWDGGGTTNNWSEAANWNFDRVPEADDIVVFNVTSTKSSTIDSSFAGAVGEVQVSAGYTGTIVMQRGLAVAGDFTQASAGVLVGSTTLDVNGDFTHTGGVINFGSGTINVGGDFNSTGTLFAGSSTLTLDGTADQDLGSASTLNHLTFANTGGTVTLTDNLNLSGNLTHTSGLFDHDDEIVALVGTGNQTIDAAGIRFDGITLDGVSALTIIGSLNLDDNLIINNVVSINGGPIRLEGDLTLVDDAWTGDTTIVLNGANDQFVDADGTSGVVTNLTIDKLTGDTTLSDTIWLSGNLNVANGTVIANGLRLNATGTTVGTIDSSIGPINRFTVDSSATKTINGNLTTSDLSLTNVATLDGGKIIATGNVNLFDSTYDGTASIELGGGNAQTVSGFADRMVRNLIVNKSNGTATLTQNLNIEGSFTHVAGSFSATNVTTTFRSGGLQLDTSGGTSGNVAFGNVDFSINASFTLASDVFVGGNLTLRSLAIPSNGAGHQIFVAGNVHSLDNSVAGNVAMTLNGTGNQTISGLDLLDGTITINKASGIVQLTDDLILNGSGQSIIVTSGILDTFGYNTTASGGVTIGSGLLAGGGSITGDLTVQSDGVVRVPVPSVASHSVRSVSGVLTLAAGFTLELNIGGVTDGGLVDGVVTYGSRVDSFGNIHLLNDAVGFTPYETYNNIAGTVDVFLNTAPTTTIGNFSVSEDSGNSSIDLKSHFSDLQHTDAQLSFTLDSRTNPSLLSSALIDANGILRITPAVNANGFTDLTVTVADPLGDSITTTFRITVFPVNDAPEVTAPATATVVESGTLVFNAFGAGVIDTFDVDTTNLTVTLTANHAAIALAQTTGLTLSDNDGSDGTLSFSGSQANIDAALNGLVYNSQSGFNGAATLTILANDGALTDTHIVSVTVNPGTSVFVWDGGGATNNWSDALNWNHDLVPEADDIVVFNVTSVKDATVDASFAGAVSQIQLNSGYTGTITQNRSLDVSGDYTHVSGNHTFIGQTLNVDGNFTHTGGNSVWGTGRLEVAGNFTNSASISTSGSTLVFDGSSSQIYTNNGFPFGNVEINKSGGSLSLQSNLDLTGNLTHISGNVNFGTSQVGLLGTTTQILNASSLTFNDFRINNGSTVTVTGSLNVGAALTLTNVGSINGGPINVAGNVLTNDDGYAGTSVIVLNGTGSQSVSSSGAGVLNHLTIDKTNGTATLTGSLRVDGNLIRTAGSVTATALSLEVGGNGNSTIDGSIGPISNLNVNASGIKTLAGTLVVNGNTVVTAAAELNGGTIRALGNVNTFAQYTGSTNLELAGSSSQTILSGGDTGIYRNLIVNKTGGAATFGEKINLRGNFTYLAGTLNSGAFETAFGGSGLNINAGSLALGNVAFTASSTGSITGNLNVNQLNLNSINTLDGGEIQVRGNLIGIDTTVGGTTAIRLNGTANQSINVADTMNGNIIIDKATGVATLGNNLTLNGSGQNLQVVQGTLNAANRTITTNVGAVFVNGGTLAGGGAIVGNLNIGSGGTLALSAASSGSYQQLAFNGSATITGATLSLDVTGNTVGGLLNDVLSSTTLTGTWGNVVLVNNATGFTAFTTYDSPTGEVDVFLNTAPTGTIPDVNVNEDAADTTIDLAALFSDLQHSDAEITYSLIGYTNPSLLTAATVDNAADTLTLDYAADQNGSYTITVRATDARGQFTDALFDVNVAAVNDAPIVTSPTTATVAESGTLTFNGVGAGIIDTLDIDTTNLTMTLSANHAAITLAQVTGLTLIDNDGSDGTLSFSGSQTNIDAALNGLVYVSQSGYNGAATLTILADDGALTDTHIVNVTVNLGSSVFVWDGGGTTNDWTDAANWNHNLVPEADDVVVFDATSSKNATINASFAGAVSEIQVNTGYTGTITQARTLAIASDLDIESGTFFTGNFALDINDDLYVDGGTFNAGTSTINIFDNFEQTAGTLVMTSSTVVFDGNDVQSFELIDAVGNIQLAGTGTVELGSTIGFAGNFTHTSGLFDHSDEIVVLVGPGNQTIDAAGIRFDGITLNGVGALTIVGSLNLDDNLIINAVDSINGGPINVEGDVSLIDDAWTGDTTIVLDGANDQFVAAGSDSGVITNLTINKTNGNTMLLDRILISGNLQVVSGTVDATGLGLTLTSGSGTIDGDIGNIGFLTIDASSGTKTIDGVLSVDGATTLTDVNTLSGGTIRVLGDVSTSDASYLGDATLQLAGSAIQSVSGTGSLRNLEINKTGGTATTNSDLTIRGGFTNTAGDFDASGHLTTFAGDGLSIDGNGATFGDVAFANNATISLASDLTIGGDLNISGMAGNSFGNGNMIFVAGNLTSSDVQVVGDFAISLNGTGNQTISGQDFTDGDIIIDKASGIASLGSNLGVGHSINLINVSSGILDLAGYMIATNNGVVVNNATLQGSGTITDNLEIGFNAILALDVTSASVYESISVGGTLVLDSTSTLRLDVTGVTAGGMLNDLLTSASLTGTFNTISFANNNIGLTPFATYKSPNGSVDVFLNTEPTGAIADVTVDEDAPNTVIDLADAFADLEHSDAQLTYTIVGNTNTAIFASVILDNTADTLTLDYAANMHGSSDITVRVSDGYETNDVVFTVTINSVNDTPVASDGTNSAVEDGSVVNGTLTASDNDPGDTLIYSLISGTSEGTAVVNSNGSYTFDPGSDFQDLAAGETRDVTFVYQVTDNGVGTLSDQATVTITVTGVNDAPVESTIEGTAIAYTENAGAVAITSTLAISDLDDTNIESAVVQISGNHAGVQDVLAFTNQNGITGNLVGNTLTLTGSATLAQYEMALRSITYTNTSDNPSALTRTISFTVNDGDANSNTLTRDIAFTSVNDAPVQATIEGTPLAYSENDGAVAITSTITFTDVDDTNVESAMVQISGNYAGAQDVLAFTNQNGISGNLVGNTLTLTGSATLAQYETALRSITYNNTSDNPSALTRTISFTVNDGDANSNTQTRDIAFTAVNDAPVQATIEATALNYTENDGAVAITSTLAITDLDDTNIESAVVQISGNYAGAEDVLTFTDQNGITGSLVGNTLTLTGSDTLAQYETALRSITYTNSSDNPSALTRTISFTVNDGDANSNTLTRDISFTAVNDAPVQATIEGTALAYTENAGAVAITSTLAISDFDDTNIESAIVQISGNYVGTEDVLAFTNQNGITGNLVGNRLTLTGSATLAQYETALRSITYTNTSDNPSALTRTISFTVNDGDANSNTLTREIDFTAVNDAPVESTIEGTALAYTENAGPVAITSTLAISDLDDTNIEAAVVQISGNYAVL